MLKPRLDLADDECVERFHRQKTWWFVIAAPTAVLLWLLFSASLHNAAPLWLQVGGLGGLGLFAVATFLWARCPRCARVLINKRELAAGWAYRECPHCSAPLRFRRY